MQYLKSKIYPFLTLVGVLLLVYSFSRILFIWSNHNEFEINGIKSLLYLMLVGLRFDLSAICLTNAVFAILFLFPISIKESRVYKTVLKTLFLVANGFFIFINLVDVVYYPFIQKRMQSDALLFVNGEKGGEAFGMIPTFAYQYWYIWVSYIVLIFGLSKVYKFIMNKTSFTKSSLKSGFIDFGIYVFAIGLLVIGIRGGLQMRPLSVINATESTSTQNVPIVLNSPFTLLRTINKDALHDVKYFDQNVLNNCEKGIHNQAITQDSLHKLNVVFIIVESLSKQYLSCFNGTGKTPFLDSLFSESFVFTNGFANGRESIQGIPAVLASIPSLQEEPFIFSRYSSNEINSVASLLKNDGYTSSFFHGASTGTMGFHSFSKLAGFDHYFGLEDYGDKKDFDGSWGIWDEPFLQYMNNKLSAQKQPFVASILTLNSHHPFKLPEKYQSRFKQKGHPILTSIQYVDYSLQQFFKSASQETWYENTLFVLTADHTGPNTDVLKNILDEYRIPIVFFRPDGSLKGTSTKMANQMDILPTVLGLLKFDKPYYSQGIDLFSNLCEGAAINYKMGIYQYIDSTYCYQFNGEKGIGLYNWKKDKFLKKNLIKSAQESNSIEALDRNLKKRIQTYNHTMLLNKMTAKTKGN